MHTSACVYSQLTMINNISWGIALYVKARLWTRMAFCAHRTRLIYHDSFGNAASVSFAMLTCLQTMLTWLNSWTGRGLIVQRWPIATWELIITSSVCVKTNLHIVSTVSLRWWNIISWYTCSVHSQNSTDSLLLPFPIEPAHLPTLSHYSHSNPLQLFIFEFLIVNRKLCSTLIIIADCCFHLCARGLRWVSI